MPCLQERNDFAYAMSFGDKEAMSLSLAEPSALSAIMKEQLEYSVGQLITKQPKTTTTKRLDTMELPKTLTDAMRQKSRAIVVTETSKPFRVVEVNETWEGLCGYTYSEARGQSLGKLLKGPNTNQVAATGLIVRLLNGEEGGAVLTNYTKEGREFRNRIRVGPLYDASGEHITHFVGVLEELKEQKM